MKSNSSNDGDMVFRNYSSDSQSDLDLRVRHLSKPLDPHSYFARKTTKNSRENSLEINSVRRSRSRTKNSFDRNDRQHKGQFNHNSQLDSGHCSCKKKNEVPTSGRETSPAIRGNNYRFSKQNIDYKKLYSEAMDPISSRVKKSPKGTLPFREMVQNNVPVYSVHVESNRTSNQRTSTSQNIPLCLCNPKNRAALKGKPPGKGVQCPFYRALSLNRGSLHHGSLHHGSLAHGSLHHGSLNRGSLNGVPLEQLTPEELASIHSARHSTMHSSIHEAIRRSSLGQIDPRFSSGHPLLTESITQTDPIPMEDKQVDADISDDEQVMFLQQIEGEEVRKWKCRPVKDDGMICPGNCCENGCGGNFDEALWCGPDLEMFDGLDWLPPCCCVKVSEGQECPGMDDTHFRKASRERSLSGSASTPKSKKSIKDKRKKSQSKSLVKEKKSIGTSYTKFEGETPKKKERERTEKTFPRNVFQYDRKERRQSDSEVFRHRKKRIQSEDSSSANMKGSSSPSSTPSKTRYRFKNRVKSIAYQTDPDQLLGRAFRRALEKHDLEEVSPPPYDTLKGKITLEETGNDKKKNCDDIYSSFECRNREVTPESNLIIRHILKKHSAQIKGHKEKSKKQKKRGKFILGSDTTDQAAVKASPTTKLKIISFSADSTDLRLKSGDVPQVSSSGCAPLPSKREYGIKKMKLNKSCRSAYVLVKRRK